MFQTFVSDIAWVLATISNVGRDLLHGFLVILNFIQVLTFSIDQFVVCLRWSNWRTIIHHSKRWSNEKCWQNSNVSLRLTRLMSYQGQETKNIFWNIKKHELLSPFYVKKWADQENEIDYRHSPLYKSHLKIIWFKSWMVENSQKLINIIMKNHASSEHQQFP